jgi:hypothetical protein
MDGRERDHVGLNKVGALLACIGKRKTELPIPAEDVCTLPLPQPSPAF